MADVVKYLAQEIVNSDYLWSRLDSNGKINMLRRSMGLPINPRFDQIQSCNGLEEKEGRTIFVKIHLEEYIISWEVLNQVFSSVGDIEIIEVFDNDVPFHSRICFKNRASAIDAFNSLNGRNIYDGSCQMELFLFLDGHKSDKLSNEAPIEDASSGRLNQVEAPIEDASQFEGHQAPINSQKMIHADIEEIQMFHASLKDNNQSEKRQIARISNLGVPPSDKAEEIEIPSSHMVNSSQQSFLGNNFERQVNLGVTDSGNHVEQSEGKILEEPLEEINWEISRDTRDRSFSIDFELRGNVPFLNLELPLFGDCSCVRQCEKHYGIGGIFDAQQVFETSENAIAHKVFPEMSRFGVFEIEPNVIRHEVKFPLVGDMMVDKQKWWDGNLVFDPGISDTSSSKWSLSIFVWFSRGDLSGHQFSLGMSGFTDSNKLLYDFPEQEKMMNVALRKSCYSLKMMPSCEYDSMIVNLKVGNDIFIFDPGIDHYGQLSSLIDRFLVLTRAEPLPGMLLD